MVLESTLFKITDRDFIWSEARSIYRTYVCPAARAVCCLGLLVITHRCLQRLRYAAAVVFSLREIGLRFWDVMAECDVVEVSICNNNINNQADNTYNQHLPKHQVCVASWQLQYLPKHKRCVASRSGWLCCVVPWCCELRNLQDAVTLFLPSV